MANLKDLLVNGPSSLIGDVGISGRLTAQNSTINSLLTNGTYEAAKSQSEQRDGDSSAKTYYYPVKWKFNTNNFTIHNGDMITIKTPYTGHDYGIFLSLDNGSTYYPIIASNTVRLTDQYGAGQHIMLVFENTASAASIYPLEGAKARVTISGGAWRVINYYDSNTIPGYCSTGATTTEKYASCSGYVLKPNRYIPIIITTTNTAKSALTLNVNSTGAKPIYINNSASSSSNYDLQAGSYIVFYDGENYYFRTDGFLPGLGNIIKVCSGTVGSAGYIKIAQLKVLAAYQNRPITIELAQRGSSTTTNISILFLNSDSKDPTLYSFIATGPCKNIFMNKSATSTWDLYVQKSESYDDIVIYKCLHSTSAGISITWTDSQISSAISDWTQATSRDIFHLSSVSHLSWDNATTNYYITKGALAYWNGAYLSPSAADPKSNLKYLQYASFSDNGHFIPKTTETYNLGSSSYKWDQVYLNSIQFRGSSYTMNNYITSNAQNNIFFSVNGVNALVVTNTDLRPGSGKNISLGTSSNKWYGLYTNSLQVPNSGTITSSLPIKVTHASGGQKEFQIVYGDNIDFSLMVGKANSKHGLYDSKKGTNGTWILSADSTNHNWSFNGNASTATALQTAIIETSVVGSGLSHTNVIKNYYQSNASIPKEKLLSFYSNAYSNFGAEYLGYYIPDGTYGSFIALHYNDNPKFIGINQGNYYERTILTDDGAGNFLPAATNTYNLGSSTYQWNALYMNKLQVPSTGVIQANLPIHINGGFSVDNIPGSKQSSLVIYQPNKNYPAIELYRHDTSSETSKKTSWQLINENGTFKIKNNWGKVSSTATTRTENSTYTETLLSINSGSEALTNGTDPTFTAYAPIKVIHTSGKQKEIEITYSNTIDFSLMVGKANSKHGLYDSKIGSTGAWVLNTDSSHEWMFTGKKVYLAGSINANTALNSSQLVLSAVENETSGKALGIEMCYAGSDVTSNSSGKQRQSWQILNDLGTLKIRTNGNGSQYENGYLETPIQIDPDSLTSITRLKPKSIEGTFYYENSNTITIANNGSRYKKILLSKNGNNSAIFSNPPTEDGLYIISVLLLIRVPSVSMNNIFYAAGLGVLPWASISAGTYDWIDITSEGFGDSHISIKLDYRNSDTIISIETKSSTFLGGRSVEIGPKGCQIHMIKIGNRFPTVDDVYSS